MGIKYCCENKTCCYPGTNRFEMAFASEAIMDHDNIAETFCPFCKKKMVLTVLPDMDIARNMPEVQMNR